MNELRFYGSGASMTVNEEFSSLSVIEIVDGESLAEFSLDSTQAIELADWLNKRVSDWVETYELPSISPAHALAQMTQRAKMAEEDLAACDQEYKRVEASASACIAAGEALSLRALIAEEALADAQQRAKQAEAALATTQEEIDILLEPVIVDWRALSAHMNDSDEAQGAMIAVAQTIAQATLRAERAEEELALALARADRAEDDLGELVLALARATRAED